MVSSFPGGKWMTDKCDKCGSTRTEEAVLEGMALRPERASTLKKVFNVGGQVLCRVCTECGAISGLRVDPKKLGEMLT
jgi:hypothetical protein